MQQNIAELAPVYVRLSVLDAAGTTLAVQQKLMRHGDIRTTINVYGDVVTNEMQEAHSKVVQMAFRRPN